MPQNRTNTFENLLETDLAGINRYEFHQLLFTKITMGQIAAWCSLDEVHRRIEQDSTLVNDGTGEDSDRYSPLWKAAASWRRRETVEFLLEKGADVNAITRGKQTPFLGAVGGGDIEIANLLIDAGADINAQFKDGRTALHKAAEIGSGSIAKLHSPSIHPLSRPIISEHFYLAQAKPSSRDRPT